MRYCTNHSIETSVALSTPPPVSFLSRPTKNSAGVRVPTLNNSWKATISLFRLSSTPVEQHTRSRHDLIDLLLLNYI
ncbi:hypothetical protein LZ554_002336 [Drepanopeziza brunnea f. sp. 'monogermtubi']|nr:hypothetical protein LZ554_002336 [Drepanopeziza brunnea f. sp. 'monogermtubi']